MEVWKKTLQSDRYEVSDLGRVRSLYDNYKRLRASPLIMKISEATRSRDIVKGAGYCRIGLAGKLYSVHRLVAMAFLGFEEGKQVNHINSIRNDNRLINIEWVTCKENHLHAKLHGYKYLIEKPVYAYNKNGTLYKYYSYMRGAVVDGHDNGNISKAVNGIIDTYHGFIWSYTELTIAEVLKMATKPLPVKQYTLDNVLVGEYETANVPAKKYGVSSTAILNAINKKSNTSCGFIWKRINDNPIGNIDND